MAGPTDYSLTIGVQLLGHFLNTYLYGIVTFQFVVYWNSGYKDPRWIKCLVITLFVMDTVHSGVAVYQAWEMCVLNYANPAHLAIISWTISFTGCANSVTSVLSQAFLMHRLYVLTKNKYFIGFTAILSFGQLVFGFICGIRSALLHEVARYPEMYNLVIPWLTFQISSDIIITSSLAFVLFRSRTGFRSTEKVLNRLIRGAVQTGFFATTFGLGHMLSFLLANNTELHGFFVYSIGRIYTITLLDSLNSRKKIRRELGIGAMQELPTGETRTRNEIYNLSILDTTYNDEGQRSRGVVFPEPTPERSDMDSDWLRQGVYSSTTKNQIV